jgi:ATP-dependent Lon protease
MLESRSRLRRDVAELVPTDDHPQTRQGLETSWWALLVRARNGTHLQQLRRFLCHPELSFYQNQLRVLEFLRWLGRVRRRLWRDNLGLLLYGPPGVGKSPFLKALAEGPYSERAASAIGRART